MLGSGLGERLHRLLHDERLEVRGAQQKPQFPEEVPAPAESRDLFAQRSCLLNAVFDAQLVVLQRRQAAREGPFLGLRIGQ